MYRVWVSLQARLHHLPQNPHQIRVLQRRGYSLLVCQLLVDLFRLTMRALLDLHLDPEAWRQGLLQSNPDPEADDGS